MESIEILMPNHEDIVLYSKRYGFWDIDVLDLDKDADTSDPAPNLSTDFNAMVSRRLLVHRKLTRF